MLESHSGVRRCSMDPDFAEERKHRRAALRMKRKRRRRSTQLQRRVRAYSEVEGTVPVEALDVCERPLHFAAVAFAEDGALSTGRKPLEMKAPRGRGAHSGPMPGVDEYRAWKPRADRLCSECKHRTRAEDGSSVRMRRRSESAGCGARRDLMRCPDAGRCVFGGLSARHAAMCRCSVTSTRASLAGAIVHDDAPLKVRICVRQPSPPVPFRLRICVEVLGIAQVQRAIYLRGVERSAGCGVGARRRRHHGESFRRAGSASSWIEEGPERGLSRGLTQKARMQRPDGKNPKIT
jgi:hypothetical protein